MNSLNSSARNSFSTYYENYFTERAVRKINDNSENKIISENSGLTENSAKEITIKEVKI
jgi:hypothetical protein